MFGINMEHKRLLDFPVIYKVTMKWVPKQMEENH
jgi:hypothetical protein